MQKKIIFNFDDNLPFQQDAMNAIVNLFQGQDKELGDVIYRGVKKPAPNVFLEDPGRNRLDLGETDIIRNLRRVQQDNMLFPVAELDSGYNFSVEMETGTGKTYVYLRTILELYNSYNFLKFIIVVPTVAIRKGIEKSIDIGTIIRIQRKNLGLTQVEAAGLCGVGVRFWSELENGKETLHLEKVLSVLLRLGIDLKAEVRS